MYALALYVIAILRRVLGMQVVAPFVDEIAETMFHHPEQFQMVLYHSGPMGVIATQGLLQRHGVQMIVDAGKVTLKTCLFADVGLNFIERRVLVRAIEDWIEMAAVAQMFAMPAEVA